MSPLALLLLRRATIYAFVFAALLWATPKLLTSFGILGPTLDEELDSVEHSLLAARSYGAATTEPTYARAAQALLRARAAADRKERWQAKRAIAEAREGAIDAQRVALATREESRRAAQKVVQGVDRAINELEDLYSDVQKRVDKKEVDRLFSLMKSTRAKSAVLFLSYDEQSYAKVVAGEKEVRDLLASTRQELIQARTGGRSGS